MIEALTARRLIRMNQDDDDGAALLRVITPWNLEADAELEALRAEHAALTARVAGLGQSPIITPRVVEPADCPRCARQAAEFEEERRELVRDRMLALKAAATEQGKRLRVEKALTESRATLARAQASLRQRRAPVLQARRTGSNPRRYGSEA